jgi:hypothetical protein
MYVGGLKMMICAPLIPAFWYFSGWRAAPSYAWVKQPDFAKPQSKKLYSRIKAVQRYSKAMDLALKNEEKWMRLQESSGLLLNDARSIYSTVINLHKEIIDACKVKNATSAMIRGQRAVNGLSSLILAGSAGNPISKSLRAWATYKVLQRTEESLLMDRYLDGNEVCVDENDVMEVLCERGGFKYSLVKSMDTFDQEQLLNAYLWFSKKIKPSATDSGKFSEDEVAALFCTAKMLVMKRCAEEK